jgi:SAM-dependent methyltransferase
VTGQLYRRDLALVHARGFGFYAEACAPGVLELLEPVRGGRVLELGCGSGQLTRHLLAARHDVVATDGSPAMVDLARAELPGADVRPLVLPDDPLPDAAAVVGVGHVLSYLADEQAVRRALTAAAAALAPGGVLALDLCDLAYGVARSGAPPYVRVEPDWAIATRFSVPQPDRFRRAITTFVREEDGRWRRDDEVHENVLVDVAALLPLLDEHGVDARVASSFGGAPLPDGVRVLAGRKR